MAGVPVKFRCYQCNQLLGVTRSKIGSVVACPKCATGLIVPDPDEASPAVAPATGQEAPSVPGPSPLAETTPAFLQALEAGLPVELADLRPEDIRAESTIPWSPAPEVPSPLPDPIPTAPAPEPPPPMMPPVPPTPVVAPEPDPVVSPIVPPIKIESPPLVQSRTTPARPRDLVLPRSVVASWSLFVLMAQALAFLAGLLAGHYIWKVH
jgi:hypothetical protein